MQECGEEVRVVNDDRDFHKDVLEAQLGLLQATGRGILASSTAVNSISQTGDTYLSVVNLPSLYAAMNSGESLNARRLSAPCELLLTS